MKKRMDSHGQTVPWVWEMLSGSVAQKSASRYNESNWRVGKSAEDSITDATSLVFVEEMA